MQNIKHEVRTYLLDNFLMGGTAQDVQDDTSFMDNHILDSTGFIELISYLEEQFGIRIEDEEMVPENLDNLNSIERFVSGKRASSSVGPK
jgi:acyl carrier protein